MDDMESSRRMSPKERRWADSWLPGLIAGLVLVALLTGLIGLSYAEDRLVADVGQSLALAASDIAQKPDLLLFERYGDPKSANGGAHLRNREPDTITIRSGIEPVELAMALEAGNGSGRSEGLRP